MDKVKLKYDPNLSIKENAQRCGVSESAVRKFIRVNHIDRRFDAKIAKIRHINRLKKGKSKHNFGRTVTGNWIFCQYHKEVTTNGFATIIY